MPTSTSLLWAALDARVPNCTWPDVSVHSTAAARGLTRDCLASDPTILGQTADASLRGAHCTSIIARKPPPAKEALYIVGVDGSDRAQQGVDFALSVARQGDNVMLVHIEEDNKEGTSWAPDASPCVTCNDTTCRRYVA